MKGKQYTLHELEYIEFLFISGKNSTEVAARLGICDGAVRKLRQRMRAAGWKVGTGTHIHPMPGPGERSSTAKDMAWIDHVCSQSATLREAAERLGMTLAALKSLLRRMRQADPSREVRGVGGRPPSPPRPDKN